jgi:hypothetical protein
MGREPGDSPEEPARLNGPSVSAVPYALFDRAALWCGPLGRAPRYSPWTKSGSGYPGGRCSRRTSRERLQVSRALNHRSQAHLDRLGGGSWLCHAPASR